MSELAVEVSALSVAYGAALAVDGVGFRVPAGKSLALIGPSGCGKTTTLRALAGLEPPIAGEIKIGDRVVYGANGKIDVATEQRRIGMVFQSYAIWPHMTVGENVAYPLSVQRLPTATIEARVTEALELVRLGGFAARKASALSGGQQQRVALARAIVAQPDLLLLDEPLSNLDAGLRVEVRAEIRDLQRRLGITTVYVTHDQEEAFAIADTIVVLNRGRVEQTGTPLEVYDEPQSVFVASFVGSVNLIPARVVDAAGESVTVRTEGGSTMKGRVLRPLAGAQEVVVAVRTVYPHLGATTGGTENTWPAVVSSRAFLGDWVEYTIDWSGERITVRRPAAETRFDEGQPVSLSIEPRYCVTLAR